MVVARVAVGKSVAFVLATWMLAGSVVVVAQGPPELSSAQQKQLERKLLALRSGDWSKRAAASLALAELGGAALPALAKAHQDARSLGIHALQSLISCARLRIALQHPDVAPVLLEQMHAPENNISVVAMQSLSLLPRGRLPALDASLASSNKGVRMAAMAVLGLHRAANSVVAKPLHRIALEDPELGARWRALLALGMVPDLNEQGLDVLVKALGDEDKVIRATATWSLMRQGVRGIPGLVQAIGDADVRSEASARLALLGDLARQPAIDALAVTKDPAEMQAYLRILAIVSQGDAACRETLRKYARHKQSIARSEALLALPGSGEPVADILPLLRSALRSRDAGVRAAAAEAVGVLGEKAKPLVGEVIKAWAKTVSGRGAARDAGKPFAHAVLQAKAHSRSLVESLLKLGEDNTSAASLISVCLMVMPETVDVLNAKLLRASRGQLLENLLILGGAGERGVPILLDYVAHDDRRVRTFAIRGLGMTASKSPEVAKAFRIAWQDEALQLEVAKAIRWAGGAHTTLLRKAWRDRSKLSANVQVALINAFAAQDPDAPGVVRQFAKLAVSDKSKAVQEAAIAALGRGKDSKAARERALHLVLTKQAKIRSSRARDERVQGMALLALSKLGEPSRKTVDVVEGYLLHRSIRLQRLAAAILTGFGPSASSAAVTLSRLFQVRDETLKAAVMHATAALGPDIEEIVTSLGVRLYSTNPTKVALVATALSNMTSGRRIILPDLLLALRYESRGNVGWERDFVKGAVSAGAWQVRNPEVGYSTARVMIAQMLSELAAKNAEDAKLIRPFLEEAAADPDATVAEAAKKALASF